MLEEMIRRIERLGEHATVKTVFGEPVREHGRTIIPVARVAYGYGFGGGRTGEPEHEGSAQDRGSGGGGGGGLRISPVAVLEMTDHATEIRPIVDVTRVALGGLAFAAWTVFWVTLTVRAVAKARR